MRCVRSGFCMSERSRLARMSSGASTTGGQQEASGRTVPAAPQAESHVHLGVPAATIEEVDMPGGDHRPATELQIQDPIPEIPLRDRVVFSALVTVVALFVVFTPWPLQEKLRTIGHACCAQIPSHTILFGGQPMPIDARNTGIYAGVFAVIALMWLTGRWRAALFVPAGVRTLLMLLVTAMVLDGFNSVAAEHHMHTVYPESNALRALTGTFSGMALTLLTIPLFNRLTWKKPDGVALVDDFAELAGYLLAAALVAAILLQAPIALFYPMSILSIAGLLITLTYVNTCILVVSFRRENQIGSLGAFVIPALAGLTLTCCEIMAIDYLRALQR
jgi:uncharacterized membrane protein